MKENQISFHVDMDSPKVLLRFWGHEHVEVNLNRFYEIAMGRALQLFEDCRIPVSFFCIGKEIEESDTARIRIWQAFEQGHEIANHTYSHPLSLRSLGDSELRSEIERCSSVIRDTIGVSPVGFRAPSYEVDARLINLLEELSFHYDSSAFWSVLKPLMKSYHFFSRRRGKGAAFGDGAFRVPQSPYFPSRTDWKDAGGPRNIIEVPLPRSRVLNLPFYNNFHLMTGSFYRKFAVTQMRQPYLVYLFHLIEFVDMDDGIPKELKVHPSVRMRADRKIAAMRDTISTLKKRYRVIRTSDYVQQINSRSKKYPEVVPASASKSIRTRIAEEILDNR